MTFTIQLEVHPDDWEVLGELRMQAIAEALRFTLDKNMRMSYAAAMSGAMRWPTEMRPEVCVLTSVRID